MIRTAPIRATVFALFVFAVAPGLVVAQDLDAMVAEAPPLHLPPLPAL